jgi:hypothetical protein
MRNVAGPKIDKPSPRVRIPELAVGVVIVAGCVLGALVWQRSTERGMAVLVAGRDLRRGQVLTEEDLSAALITSDRPLSLLRVSSASEIVGMRLKADLPIGTPLTPTHVADVEPIDVRYGLVGITVSNAEAPLDLMAGDAVRLVTVDDDMDGSRIVEVVDLIATVWEISIPDDIEGRRSVTLRVPIDAVIAPLGHDEVHLVKVGE